MTHNNVLLKFKVLFPQYAGPMTEWFPNGKNSIRVRYSKTRPDVIFTYNSTKDWRLETIDSFIKSM